MLSGAVRSVGLRLGIVTSALAISCAGVVTPGRDDGSDGGPVAADTRVDDDAPGDVGTIAPPRPAGRLCSVAGAGAPARAGLVVQAGPNVRIRWTDETSRDHRLAVSPSHRAMYPGSLAARAGRVTASVVAQQGNSAPVESRALIDGGGHVVWERTETARAGPRRGSAPMAPWSRRGRPASSG